MHLPVSTESECFILGASLTSNGTHGFETRRKRQRLASPDSEPFSAQDGVARTITSIDHADGWKGQLLAASSRKESLATDALAYLSDSTIRSKRQNTLKVEISTVAQAHVGIDGNSATISQDSNSSTRETELMIETSSNNRREATPPKKMLSIRADGKLTSPLNRGVSINSNLRTSKRDSRPSKISKTKVLIIKYGATEERRISIARKIQAVLSRDLHTADPESKISKALKMIEPAKPTHPFFLGVSARVLGQETVDNHMADENSIVDSNDNQVDTITSPMKPRSPRRSPKIVKTWTTIPGLEGKHKPVNSTTISRSTGAMDPIWPPRSMIHVRPPVVTAANHSLVRKDTQLSTGHCKMKYATIQIVEAEEIMQPYIKLVHAEGNSGTVTRLQSIDSLRHPHRRVTTGHALQNAIRKVVASRPPDPKISSKPVDQEDELSGPQNLPISAHVASTRVFKDISTSLTAFDKFECATQIWTHKYSPKRAEEVFQTGREAMVLRDWLKSLVVTSVEDARNQAMEIRNDSTVLKRPDGGLKRKKRRREEDLDGFVVSSDEEAEKPDELANSEIYETAIQHSDPLKQSVIHTGIFADYLTGGQRAANAVVISGPHGCGKTAAVYAVAQELDFEVFEINAGSRRSGKDVLEKVGDMTRNHLVNQARTSEENKKVGNSVEISGSVRPDLKPGPNGTLIASFKSKHKITKNPKGRLKRRKSCQDDEDEGREQPSQKQSVILLEEVDVLFEEDKQFWAAAMDLLTHSKRPIIMTCTDENMLPLNDMLLFAILRFTPPPKLLAIDYLLLIACNEGHLLSREAVTLLLKSKNYDLRASIMQLNFFCQMAVGDTKGGLEWMLIRPSTDRPHSEERKPLRVVSEGTYWDGVGCIGCEQPPFEWQISSGAAEYSLRNGSGSDVDAEMSFGCHSTTFSDETCREPKESSLRRLADLEQALDAVSAADIHPFSAFRHDNLVSAKRLGLVIMLILSRLRSTRLFQSFLKGINQISLKDRL